MLSQKLLIIVELYTWLCKRLINSDGVHSYSDKSEIIELPKFVDMVMGAFECEANFYGRLHPKDDQQEHKWFRTDTVHFEQNV